MKINQLQVDCKSLLKSSQKNTSITLSKILKREMKRISSALIQPSIVALGASIFLYSYNNQLRYVDYFLHIPFWITVVRPTGLYWQSVFLKEINKGVFPPEMKVYREMYVASKNAILYDVVLNHTLYHSILTPLLISYMYLVNELVKGSKFDKRQKTIAEGKEKHNSLAVILKESFLKLVQGRVLISCASILSEYWITYASLKKQGSQSTLSLPTNVKRLLMAKEMLLSWSWSGLILKEFYQNYWIDEKKEQSAQKENI